MGLQHKQTKSLRCCMQEMEQYLTPCKATKTSSLIDIWVSERRNEPGASFRQRPNKTEYRRYCLNDGQSEGRAGAQLCPEPDVSSCDGLSLPQTQYA